MPDDAVVIHVRDSHVLFQRDHLRAGGRDLPVGPLAGGHRGELEHRVWDLVRVRGLWGILDLPELGQPLVQRGLVLVVILVVAQPDGLPPLAAQLLELGVYLLGRLVEVAVAAVAETEYVVVHPRQRVWRVGALGEGVPELGGRPRHVALARGGAEDQDVLVLGQVLDAADLVQVQDGHVVVARLAHLLGAQRELGRRPRVAAHQDRQGHPRGLPRVLASRHPLELVMPAGHELLEGGLHLVGDFGVGAGEGHEAVLCGSELLDGAREALAVEPERVLALGP
mmetsp:Transcript_127940/g.343320  ORF Transcript_127940/g.343320 Transcript_127940/m.343320 type:complete len:282 (-) Transcript_127940:441-1286(-)